MRVMKKSFLLNSRQEVTPSALMMEVANDDSHQAFEELYRQLYKKLYKFVYFIVLDDEKAQELVHDAFLTLYDKRKMYRKEYQITTWLWTIARNKSYDFLKKIKEVSVEDDVITKIEDKEISALEKLVTNATSETIKNALFELPNSQRECITLWMEDHSGEEMAEVLGKSKQAIKNLVNRAKLNLKEILEREMESL